MSLEGKRVMIVGGSAGIGYAIAEAVLAAGACVLIASRSAEKLATAAHRLNGDVETAVVDVTDEAAVRDLFDRCGELDHVATTAAVVDRTPLFDLTASAAHAAFESKFWGQFYVARCAAPHLAPNGSITLTSGISSRIGIEQLVITGAINAAIESLCRSLAVTLTPLRVNAVSPGYIDTPGHDDPQGRRRSVLDAVGRSIPVGRVGRPDEVARTVLYLMQSEFTTGTVVDIDGGHLASRPLR